MTDVETTESRPDYEIAREQLAALMAREGLTVAATFVPFSRSRNADATTSDGRPWVTLNWRVQLVKAGRNMIETDYSAGSAHTPAYNAPASLFVTAHMPERRAREELEAWECENGFAGHYLIGTIRRRGPSSAYPPLMPDPVAVFSSLLTDSDVLNYSGFEEWASSFGYDPDSRKAESIYRACLEIAVKLRNGLGEAVLTEAMELAGRL